MYEFYYMPGACSLAFHTMLLDLGVSFKLINKADVEDYAAINPAGTAPVLRDGDLLIREGAAIALHLATKHETPLLPLDGAGRGAAIHEMMFANATLHPAYSKLFFIAGAIEDEAAKGQALEAAADRVARLWQIVDAKLAQQAFVAGPELTIADIMLAVYANWGQFFPVDIPLGKNVERLLAAVHSRPTFKAALEREGVTYKAAA